MEKRHSPYPTIGFIVPEKKMNAYQKEQREALKLICRYLPELKVNGLDVLEEKISVYLAFREDVDTFLSENFSHICTQSCYKSKRSACCTKEGIITFFADVVINALLSGKDELDTIFSVLNSPHVGYKCIYLGNNGCLWRVKPLVCEMFLCGEAEKTIFSENEARRESWQILKQREKSFRWPDEPVLFDDIEDVFLNAGVSSSLMYLHNSPGLLNVKKKGAAG
jgi:hypothetical protein